MTGYDVEEHKSRTPPKSAMMERTGTDSVDGSRVLVERMPSVISGTPPRTNGTPPKHGLHGTPPKQGPPVVKLDTKFSSNSASSSVTLTNETQTHHKPEGRRKKLRRKKYGSSPSHTPRRPSPGKSPVRFPSNHSEDTMATSGAIKPLALRAVMETTQSQSTSSSDGRSIFYAFKHYTVSTICRN